MAAADPRRVAHIHALAGFDEPPPPDDDAPLPPSSWTPVAWDAVTDGPPPAPAILMDPEAGSGVIYAGARHLVVGKPEAAKSWFLLACCLDVIRRLDKRAVFVDFDLMGARAAKGRLQALGYTRTEMDRLLFVEPDQAFDEQARAIWAAELAGGDIGIACFDAQNPGLELQGLSPNSDEDVARFQREVIGPFHRAGAAVIIADHLPKDREAPREYAINSQRKLAGADVSLRLELAGPPLQRAGRSTSVTIEVMKDRPGGIDRSRGRLVGRMRLHPHPDGTIDVMFDAAHQDGDEAPAFRPTALMERISRYLESNDPDDHVTQNTIEKNVVGKAAGKRAALDALLNDGYVARERDGQSWLHWSVKPYREADDPMSDRYVSDE